MAVTPNSNSYNTSSSNSPAVLSLNSGKNVTFYSIAASYKFDTGTFVGGNYEWGTFDQVGGGQLKQDDWLIALGQDFGAASVKLSYGQLGTLKNTSAGVNGDDFKAKQWILGGTQPVQDHPVVGLLHQDQQQRQGQGQLRQQPGIRQHQC